MSSIRILTEKVASQIAAGEVIERPSSVVRELLDNSIDAGAGAVTLRIENGGKRLIRVSDNGAGMDRDDLLLSVERHATSKISDVSDLMTVRTLGFRGEALPSIASVSRMRITSRPPEQLVGHRLSVAGGKLVSIDETGSPPGTTLEVRDLFFNVPARRKFLRSAKTETDHILDTFTRIVLPFAGIHFRLEEGDRTILQLPDSARDLNRLSILMGRQVAGSMTETRRESDGVVVRAYLGSPEFSRSRGDRILLYVNNRSIRDRLMLRAVMEGYGQRLMKGRFPQAVVFLEVDPDSVDVNVHPTKQEIRFRQGDLVYRTLLSTVEKSLRETFHVPFEPDAPPRGEWRHFAQEKRVAAEPEGRYRLSGRGGEPAPREAPRQEPLLREGLQIIGQLKDTYILCQGREGLIMVDQHAAHERIVYETLRRNYRDSRVESQAFLIPHKLELSMKDGARVLRNLDHLAGLGLELEHFGGGTFLLRAVPSLIVDAPLQDFLGEIIPLLEEEGDLSREASVDRLLTLMACHGAVRAGKRLSHQEMAALLRGLEEMDLPTNCPHGRPIFREFSFHEIEKMFKRVG